VTDLYLNRAEYGPVATTGAFTGAGLSLFSIEQPWRDNEKGASCVPEGQYALIPYNSPMHGWTWYLQNHVLDVGGANEPRGYCELHAGNWARQLQGCIALGLIGQPMLDPATGIVEPAVGESRAAIEELFDKLGQMTTGHTLTITSPGGPPNV